MSSERATPVLRSLADDLRARSDAELADLLIARPDLARPAPADLTSLAARAVTKASVQRAIESLNRAQLQVLEAAWVAGDDAQEQDIAALLGPIEDVQEPVCDALAHLRKLALVWGAPGAVRVVRPVGEVLGPFVAGLAGRAPVSAQWTTVRAEDALAQAPESARRVIDALVWGPPSAVIGSGAGAREASKWLVERKLVQTDGSGQIVLPAPLALALRGGRVHRSVELTPPPTPANPAVPQPDSGAGAHIMAFLDLVDDVELLWANDPPRVLRAGGVAVRDLAKVAQSLQVDENQAALVLHVLSAAQLIASDGAVSPHWGFTAVVDGWQQGTPAERWATLALAWSTDTRDSHRVGQSARIGTGHVNALSAETHWPPIRALRAEVLGLLATQPHGIPLSAEDILTALSWQRPLRRSAALRDGITAILSDTETLGLTHRGALTSAGRVLVDQASDPDLADLLATAVQDALPELVDEVFVQADLTAVAPGPMTPALAQVMRSSAVIESRGAATVFRFQPDSVRRALDQGATGSELLARLEAVSATPLPQPLTYLIADVARRHGSTRVGAAASFLRTDDEAGLDAMVAHRSLGLLQLRKIAPTVAISTQPPTTVVDLMREHGFSPVIEGPDGIVVSAEAARQRVVSRAPGPAPVTIATLGQEAASAAVGALRRGEEQRERAAADPHAHPAADIAVDPVVTIAALRDAAAESVALWLTVVDHIGRRSRIMFYPKRIDGGRVTGIESITGEERTYSVHRIVNVQQS